jgi:two-component system invasion response regulator UvrY
LSKKIITILLVDDHTLVRVAVKNVLSDHPKLKVIGEAKSGKEAIALAQQLKPNVILMDIEMPDMDGIEATKKLLRQNPKNKILILTTHDHVDYHSLLFKYGALGYLNKNATVEQITDAIYAVSAGNRYISPNIAQAVVNFENYEKLSLLKVLTPRELEILLYLIKGTDVHDLAKQLFLSAKTIYGYQAKIYQKLQVHNTVQLVHIANQLGLCKHL